jgi:hypothetical protein
MVINQSINQSIKESAMINEFIYDVENALYLNGEETAYFDEQMEEWNDNVVSLSAFTMATIVHRYPELGLVMTDPDSHNSHVWTVKAPNGRSVEMGEQETPDYIRKAIRICDTFPDGNTWMVDEEVDLADAFRWMLAK